MRYWTILGESGNDFTLVILIRTGSGDYVSNVTSRHWRGGQDWSILVLGHVPCYPMGLVRDGD